MARKDIGREFISTRKRGREGGDERGAKSVFSRDESEGPATPGAGSFCEKRRDKPSRRFRPRISMARRLFILFRGSERKRRREPALPASVRSNVWVAGCRNIPPARGRSETAKTIPSVSRHKNAARARVAHCLPRCRGIETITPGIKANPVKRAPSWSGGREWKGRVMNSGADRRTSILCYRGSNNNSANNRLPSCVGDTANRQNAQWQRQLRKITENTCPPREEYRCHFRRRRKEIDFYVRASLTEAARVLFPATCSEIKT